MKQELGEFLVALEELNNRLSALIEEAEICNATEEDKFFCLFGGMFYTAPALLHELVRKCHDERYAIDERIAKILEDRGLLKKGKIPQNVKNYLTEHFKTTKEGGICMSIGA